MPSTSRSLSTVSAKKSKEVDYVTLDSDDEEIIVPDSAVKVKEDSFSFDSNKTSIIEIDYVTLLCSICKQFTLTSNLQSHCESNR